MDLELERCRQQAGFPVIKEKEEPLPSASEADPEAEGRREPTQEEWRQVGVAGAALCSLAAFGKEQGFQKNRTNLLLACKFRVGFFLPLFLSLPGVRTPQKDIGICLMTPTLEFYKGWEDVVGGLYRLSELGLVT